MNICITKQLASLSYRCLTTSRSTPANPGLACSLWTSARCQTVRYRACIHSSHIQRLYTHLKTASLQARRCFRPSLCGRWRTVWQSLRPRRLSDRSVERCGLALAASWFTMLTVQSECDEVDFDLLVKNKILSPEEEQTGWERLSAMYTLDEMGGLTPELELVANIATAGLLIGGALGAMLNGRLAVIKFVERNQATPFESQLAAKRALQDRVTLGMARGFFMFGWRTALFTSAFTLVSTTLMVYTNQISALHYSCGGVVAGALYKANMGLRGMTAGAVAGGLLGLVGGGLFSLTCYLTDTTLPKLRYQQYVWKHQQELRDLARAERKREKKRLEAEKKLEEKKEEIVQSHLQESLAMSSRGSSNSQGAMSEQYSSNSGETGTGERGMTETEPDAAKVGECAGTEVRIGLASVSSAEKAS